MHPEAIGRRIIDIGKRLDELVAEYQNLGEACADAKKTFKLAQARAFLKAEGGTVDARRALATIEAADAEHELDVLTYRHTTCREAIRAAHAHLDAARTLASNLRAEMNLAGTGVTP
ncbi:hypothetical protein GCM10022221_68550 [Actinocorallia aurea]